MTAHTQSPPSVAVWLLKLVATPEQAETMLGDLLEEFSTIVTQSGAAAGRRWFWWQTMRSVGHLTRSQIRNAPVVMIAFGTAGFFLYVLVQRALQVSAQLLVAHSHVYYVLDAVAFWSIVDVVGRFVLPVVVGWMVARATRGREIAAVLCVGLIESLWVVTVYTNMLPNFGLTSIFCPVESGPPHSPSVMNTLRLLRFTVTHWWIPGMLLMLTGAAIRRTSAAARLRICESEN